MSTYRTGNHWGVTIVREGDMVTLDGNSVREHDQLVAVVVNGDQALAERICALLNAASAGVFACDQCDDDRYHRHAHRALKTMLGVLDGWIQGQQENHQGMGHRHENRGDECWRTFAPSDIRRMVNDAAREVGLDTEFAEPEMAQEDRPL